jgi:hypothetical protein
MKPSALTVALGTCLLTIACATSPSPSPQTAVSYNSGDLARIMRMRDNGEGLADVARQVGGTRADVRAAERRELARRRARATDPVVDEGAAEPERLELSTSGSTSLEAELGLIAAGFAVSW